MRTGVSAVRLAAANGIENVKLVGLECSIEAFEAFDVVAADKDVDMLADLTLLGEDAIAQRGINFPKRIESLTDGREIRIELSLRLAAGVAFEMSA